MIAKFIVGNFAFSTFVKALPFLKILFVRERERQRESESTAGGAAGRGRSGLSSEQGAQCRT